jgi:hypothetical protein
MATTVFHRGPAYELSLSVRRVDLGHCLEFSSFVPTARQPRQQVRLQTVLSVAELAELQRAIWLALQAAERGAVVTADPAIPGATGAAGA